MSLTGQFELLISTKRIRIDQKYIIVLHKFNARPHICSDSHMLQNFRNGEAFRQIMTAKISPIRFLPEKNRSLHEIILIPEI